MSPQLPLDVLINILTLLPASRDRRETSVLTLVSCLKVSSLWNEAASQPLLWKDHYQTRYEHCDEDQERSRIASLQDDWRVLYARRRQMDNMALECLSKIIISRINRQALATSLADYGMDVFDVLELESTLLLVPQPFADDSISDSIGDQRILEHALTRRYWAKSIADTISRGHGISIWGKFWTAFTREEKPTFEETMSSLSTFFGVSERRIKRLLDDLASQCREGLKAKGICLDYTNRNYDLPELCKEICVFMHKHGYTRVSHYTYPHINPDSDILNKFPHGYLTTKRATIPISLVHIFIAIATRFGVQAAPINFPGVVLTYVLPYGPNAKAFIVNPSTSDPVYAVISRDSPLSENPLMQLQMVVHHMNEEHLKPCDTELMLMRACANISATFSTLHDLNRPEVRPSTLLPLCANLLFQADDHTLGTQLSHAHLRPLDCIFLLKNLAPMLKPRCENHLRNHCNRVLHDEENLESSIRKRTPQSPRFFVGMAFRHAQLGYLGFIWGWDDGCRAAESWISQMQVDSLSRGRNQPFYYVYSIDGSQRYIAEENITPVSFNEDHVRSFFEKFEDFPGLFEGVELPEQPPEGVNHPEGRGKLILSPHSRYSYPDDSDVGSHWVKSGKFELP